MSAANIFFKQTKITGSVSIELKKKFLMAPVWVEEAAMHASTLLALNELFETEFARGALAKMAETIGSDVPFFIFESAATCKGRGELVSPARLREPFPLLLLETSVRGSDAVGLLSVARLTRNYRSFYGNQQFNRQTFVNDLERPVFEKFVFLAQLKMWLLKQPEVGAALMSGSGSDGFCGVRGDANVGDISHSARKRSSIREFWTCVCETR